MHEQEDLNTWQRKAKSRKMLVEKTRDCRQGESPRRGQEMWACFPPTRWALTVCSCRQYPQTPSSGPGTQDLWTPKREPAMVSPSINADGERPSSHRAPSGTAGAVRQADFVLPRSAHTGHPPLLPRLPQPPRTSRPPQVISFSHFHLL